VRTICAITTLISAVAAGLALGSFIFLLQYELTYHVKVALFVAIFLLLATDILILILSSILCIKPHSVCWTRCWLYTISLARSAQLLIIAAFVGTGWGELQRQFSTRSIKTVEATHFIVFSSWTSAVILLWLFTYYAWHCVFCKDIIYSI
jgi:hypothetical protein